MRRLFGCAGLLVLLFLSACAATGPSVGTVPAKSAALPAPDPVTSTLARPEYQIGPNDLLSVVVFQVEDLAREVRVNNAGQISLPLIGTVDAAGLGVQQLETIIEAKYRERFLQDPQVSVFVKEFASQRVTVEGSVTRPGIFPMPSRLSLLQAIALAQGPTRVANEHNVIIFRTVAGERSFARFDLPAIREGREPDPEVFGEDIVVVDESAGKLWLRWVIELTPLLGVWSVFE